MPNPIPLKVVETLFRSLSGASNELHLGMPNSECASCRKPFGSVRGRCKAVRVHSLLHPISMAFEFDICRSCVALHKRGGASRVSVLVAVKAYCEGTEASQ